MRIFKAYFLILNKYKGTVFIFFAVFMSLSLIMAKVNGGGGASILFSAGQFGYRSCG